mgnify:CR=1 FL=1
MKARSFQAKLAHELSTHGKVMCPKCDTEIKKIKIIKNKKGKKGFAPKYQFLNICKCNEKDILAGNID